MKKLLLLLIIPFLSFGQGWEQTLGGGGIGNSVQQTSDGGYIIAGTADEQYVYLIKTDANGIEQWAQLFGGGGLFYNYYGYSVQQTSDGGYVITGGGVFDIEEGIDVFLIKTDANGNEQWTQSFGGTDDDYGRSVQQTTDGGYIITGYTGLDVYLIKTNEIGEEQWSRTYGGSGRGYSVQQTTDGGYIITGSSGSWGVEVGEGAGVYLLKTNETGIWQWTQTFGGTGSDVSYSVQQTTDGGYIIAGETSSFGNGMYNVYLIKTDEIGVEQWSQTFGGAGGYNGRSVQQTTDGGYIITGFAKTWGNEEYDVYLIKTDGTGIEQWNQSFGGAGGDYGYSVQQTTDGGYIITGSTTDEDWNTDVYLIKTNEWGNITSTIELPSINKNLITKIDILGRETTNKGFSIEIYDDGSVEKKYLIK